MTRLVTTKEAEADVEDILRHLERVAGPKVAADYGSSFSETMKRLLLWPESGAKRPMLGPNVRIAVVAPYNLIHDYDSASDTLTLLRVLHGKRKVTPGMIP